MILLIVTEQISCAGVEKDRQLMLNMAMLGIADHKSAP